MANEIKQTILIDANISAVKNELNKLESNFKSSFGRINANAISALGTIGTGLAIAGAAAGGALIALAKQAADYADTMGKAAQRSGTTTEFISALAHGAKLADVEFEGLTKGIGGFNRVIAEAAKGSASAKEPFAALGINIRNASGALKTNEELLGEVADAFQKMPDGIKKSALAQDLFTKSGAALIPLLNGGSEGIKEFTKEAQRMGLIVTGEAAAAAEKFNDDLTRLQSSVKGAGLAIGGALVPAFAELAKSMLDFINSPGVRDILGWSAQLMKYWAGNEAATAEIRIQNINRQLAGLQKTRDAAAKLPNQSTAGVDANIAKLNEEKRALELLVDARNQQGEAEARLRQKMAGATKPAATFIPEKAQTDKAKNEIDSFFDSLSKQIDTINQKQIELKFGDQAGLAANLDAQFARLKEKLGTKIKAFPGLEEFFTQLRDKVVASDESLRRLQETMKQLEGFDLLDASTGSKALENLEKEAARTAKSLGEQLSAIERAASLELLPESEQRIEIIRREFEERKKIALDYLDALKESGATENQITAETARVNADIAKSSQAAIQKINEENKRGAEEVTEFQRRAWERMADAISDTVNDFTTGQIKSWEDLGKRIERTITSILNEAAAMEIKKLILGADYGKKGGELGGLAKQGADLLASIFSTSAKPQNVPAFEPSAKHGGTTPVDALDAEFGQQLAALAQGGTLAIETTGTTAQASIQALQAQALAMLQTEAVTANTGITTTGTTAQAGIQAVLSAALAAIEAAKAASSSGSEGGSDIMSLFSGGGGGADIFAGGGASFAEQGAGAIGSALMMHDGGPVSKNALTADRPLKPGERFILAEDGEFMVNKEATRRVGRSDLEYVNKHLELPRIMHNGGMVGGTRDLPVMNVAKGAGQGAEGSGGNTFQIHINGVKDFESFRRGKSTLMAEAVRAMRKAQKDN